jgi:hypothetical protein
MRVQGLVAFGALGLHAKLDLFSLHILGLVGLEGAFPKFLSIVQGLVQVRLWLE